MCYRSSYQEPITNKKLHIIYVQCDFTFGKYAEYLHLEIFQGVVDQVTKDQELTKNNIIHINS